VRVVLLGDTHLPRFGRRLPDQLHAALRDADRILHVGDITQAFVLDLLAEFAPVDAVAGNNDPPDLHAALGLRRVVTLDGVRVGLVHGHHGRGRTTRERALLTFAEDDPAPDVIAFGHSHIPLVERVSSGWLLNPGSPTDRRRQPEFSFIQLEIVAREVRPTLVTYPAWR
jgi:uncharacterized protein